MPVLGTVTDVTKTLGEMTFKPPKKQSLQTHAVQPNIIQTLFYNLYDFILYSFGDSKVSKDIISG